MLLINGLDGHPGLLLEAAPRLFPGHHIVPFDHRHDRAEGDVEGLAERALAVLDTDAPGDEPAYVCGESFGSTIALTVARRYPDRVKGLILLSAFGRYPAVAGAPRRVGMALWRLFGDTAADFILRVWRPLSLPFVIGWRPPPEVRRAFLERPPLDVAAYRAKCAISLSFDARPWLNEITCPTFILIGAGDPVVPASAGRELARRVANARLHQLPGGHLAHILHVDEAARLINRWIREGEAIVPSL